MAFNIQEENVIRNIKDNLKVMVLLRGLPGCGKSTLARKIVMATGLSPPSLFIFSSDDYFKRNGRYIYDASQLGDAHAWNQKRVNDSVKKGLSPIIVDNTNLELWEMKCYTEFGVNYGYIIEVLHPTTQWAMKPNILVNKNSHGVPLNKIRQMLDKYQYPGNLNGTDLLRLVNLVYNEAMKPPHLRITPPLVWVQNAEINTVPIVDVRKDAHNHSLINFTESNVWKPAVEEPSSDPWLDSWEVVKTTKDNKPKPQRNDNRFSYKSSFTDTGNLIDWEPIDNCLNQQNFNCMDVVPIECEPKSVASKSTMTENIENLINSTEDMFYKILIGQNKDINMLTNYINKLPVVVRSKPMLDKSTTVDFEDMAKSSSDEKTQLQLLNEYSLIFEGVPREYMNHLLDKCGGNVNWAADLLMDTNTKLNITNIENIPQRENGETALNPEDFQIAGPSNASKGKGNKAAFKDKNKEKATSEDATTLKKQIESNFDFGQEYYSEHVFKLKKKVYGKPAEEMAVDQQQSNSESLNEADEVEETAEINLGHEFISHIEKMLGFTPMYNDSFKPVVNMPVSMANQIYALWMDSITNQKKQLETLMKEDEELAMQLQTLECQKDSQSLTNNTPNFQVIMDMELAWALYNSDQINQPEQPIDLATKLTHQKLVEMFPEIERNTLIEIYHAHHNNFSSTLEALLVSTGRISREVALNSDEETMGRIVKEQEQSLIQRAKKETEMVINLDSDEEDEDYDNESEEQIKESIKTFRSVAQYQLKIRNQNHSKTKECMSKGYHQAALYYSNLVSLATKKYEKANAMAASRIYQLNFGRGRDDDQKYTLNLHELHLKEAMSLLDIFLDQHISNMREKNIKSEMLFIITGRGKHSINNRPVIKPATRQRLIERGLSCNTVNPGVLRTTISSTSLLSSETKNNNNHN